MPDLTKRGFKKPLENEAYDIKVTNFNTDKIEEELDKLITNEGDGKDITVTFAEAEEDAELKSKSKLSILFGLIKKKFVLLSDLLGKKADLVGGKVKSEQLPEMDYAPTNHSHTTVNGHTVESNVPVNAKFTDTIYTHPLTHPASMITGLPTSLPASDVYPWAKAAGKPSYTVSEIGAAPSSHTHTISNVTNLQSTLDSKATIVMSTLTPTGTLAANILHCVYS